MATATLRPGAPYFPPEPGKKPAAVLAVLVHLVFLGILVFGLRWSSKVPEAVVVELWNQSPSVQPVQPAPPAPPPPQPVQKAEPPPPPPKVEPKPAPEPEPPRVVNRKPDIAVEKEKKLPVKKELPKPPPKEEKALKPPPKEEKPLKFDQTQSIKDQLARELQSTAKPAEKPAVSAPAPSAAPVADAGYMSKLAAAIRGRIVLPDNLVGNPEAVFEVIQLPTREVLSVRLLKSSGNKNLDDAWERAIRGASPLPPPDRPGQFSRELKLTFRPKD